MFYKYPKWLLAAIIGFLIIPAFGAYFKVLKAEFVYDDFGFIVNNKDIQSFSPISKFLLSPNIFTGSNYASDNGGGKNWRPVASFAFAMEYALFGKNSSGFHFVSIFLHILNLVLVYLLTIKLTKRIGIAFLTAAFWALHPALTEAVSWVTNQSSLIFLAFFLLSVFMIFKYNDGKDKKFFIWFSYLFFILSLLTKETALGGIFVILFIFLIGRKEGEKIGENQNWNTSFCKILTDFYPFILIGAAYFYVHYKILGFLGDHTLRGSFFDNLLLAPAIFYKYVSLAFYPVGLLLDYSNFILPSGIGDPRVIAGFLLAAVLIALVYLGFKKSWFNFTFGVIWFLAFLSPVMQIIPFHDIIGERFLYAPLVGFFLAAILGFDGFVSYVKSKFGWNFYPAVKIIAAIILILFFLLTFRRNNDWLNSENLWNSVLKIDALNEKALANLGGYYIDNGLASKAIEVSEKLLKISKNSAFGNINYGVGLAMAGRLEEAEKIFTYVLSKKPDYKPALVNLAAVYQNTGRYYKAFEILQKLSVRYPLDGNLKQRASQLENILKYDKSSSPSVISAFGKGEYPYIETELQAPAVEGNIVNSGIFGQAVLSGGAPFEASFDVFSSKNERVISIRTHSDGTFQVPLRPGLYVLKPADPDGPIAPARASYPFTIGGGRWLQVKIEYINN